MISEASKKHELVDVMAQTGREIPTQTCAASLPRAEEQTDLG
jgi:hypothetical protein